MVLSDVLGPIRRRWYILLLGLVLAGGIGWTTAIFAPTQYSARGLVMLLPSALTTGPKGNPLLNLGGLELPARVLIAYYSSEPAQSSLEKFAPKAEVQVSMEESTRGPIIAVDVKDSTPEGALRVLNHVTDSIPENLARIQSEVGTSKQAAIGSMPLVLDTEAERDVSLMVRLVVASSAAMLALTFFILFSMDGLLLRRASSDSDVHESRAHLPADSDELATVEDQLSPVRSEGTGASENMNEEAISPIEEALAPVTDLSPTEPGAIADSHESSLAQDLGHEEARRALPSTVGTSSSSDEDASPDELGSSSPLDPAGPTPDQTHATRTLA